MEFEDKYQATLKEANFYRKKPTKIIEMIYNGGAPVRNFPSSSGAYELDGIFKNNSFVFAEKRGFYDFVSSLAKKNVDVLGDSNAVRALFIFYGYKKEWLRDIDSWKKGSYNLERQIKSIARHLFCKFPVPKFMDNIWFSVVSTWQIKLFIHMGKGWNAKKFEELPVPLSRKEAIHFAEAPENFTPIEAILWAKVFGYGGDERLVRPMMESRIFRIMNARYDNNHALASTAYKNDWEFWETILKFFIEQPLVDVTTISPVCDYIQHIKYEHRNLPRPGGGWIYEKPENPDFKINGRTLPALVRGMEKWHKELGSSKREVNIKSWEGFDIPDYEVSFGKDENKRTYTFTQLLSAANLKAEGRIHGHCVAGYVGTCANGRTSIWSMTLSDYAGNFKNLLTVEVSPSHQIVQCRGKANRLATKQEWLIVERFAFDNKLEISRWVGHE
jgi:hypothetical protein